MRSKSRLYSMLMAVIAVVVLAAGLTLAFVFDHEARTNIFTVSNEETSGGPAYLTNGADFNALLKGLANGGDITAFTRGDEKPDPEDPGVVVVSEDAIINSIQTVPVYAWYDDEHNRILYWTEASSIYANVDCSVMFRDMETLADMDMPFSTELTENAASMFEGCDSLTHIEGHEGWDMSHVALMTAMFKGCESITELDPSDWNTASVTDIESVFEDCASVSVLDVSGWDISHITSLRKVFSGCSSLTSAGDLSAWDTKDITDMSYTFNDCASVQGLPYLEGWDVAKVVTLSHFLNGCSVLSGTGDLSGWNTGRVQDMSYLFGGCASLADLNYVDGWDTSGLVYAAGTFFGCSMITNLDLQGWDVHNVVTAYDLFAECAALTTVGDVSAWDTGKLTSTSGMFSGCRSMDDFSVLLRWDMSHITDVSRMFKNCTSVREIDFKRWWMSNVEDFSSMFEGCTSLQSLAVDYWDTRSVKTMKNMFRNCDAFTRLTMLNWDTENVIDMSGMFEDCDRLVTIGVGTYWTVENVKESTDMFKGTVNLVGQEGFAYDENFVDKTYAVPNVGGVDGYLTLIITETTLRSGSTFTLAINELRKSTGGDNLTSFEKAGGQPNFANISPTIISTSDSEFPVYFWQAGSNGYWWTSANTVYLNENSASLFSGIDLSYQIQRIKDLKYFNAERCTDMDRMFSSMRAVDELDIAGWDISNVTYLSFMFYNTTSLTTLNIAEWVPASGTEVASMFGGSGLVTIYCNHDWDGIDLTEDPDRAMFSGRVVGQNGTKCGSKKTKAYARVDVGSHYGLFTSTHPVDSYAKAVLEENGTFTFFCDDGSYHAGDVITIGGREITAKRIYSVTDYRTGEYPDWYVNDHSGETFPHDEYRTVVIDDSFADAGLTTMTRFFMNMTQLTAMTGAEKIQTENVTDLSYLFAYCQSLAEVPAIGQWDTSHVVSMDRLFNHCEDLRTISGLDGWNTENVTSMSGTFSNCSNLSELLDIGDWDVSSVTDLSDAFRKNPLIKEYHLENWEVSDALCYHIFDENDLLETIFCFNTWSGCRLAMANGYYVFYDCPALAGSNGTGQGVRYLQDSSIAAYFRPDVGNRQGIFTAGPVDTYEKVVLEEDGTFTFFCDDGVYSAGDVITIGGRNVTAKRIYSVTAYQTEDYPDWYVNSNTIHDYRTVVIDDSFTDAHFTKMAYWFKGMEDLPDMDVADGFDTSSVTTMKGLFQGCTGLHVLNLPDLDVSAVVDMSYAFTGCDALTALDLRNWNPVSCTDSSYMFHSCTNLNILYCDHDWNAIAGLAESTAMFGSGTSAYRTSLLTGGNGTLFAPAYRTKAYARPDVSGKKGYFTRGTDVIPKALFCGDGSLNFVYDSNIYAASEPYNGKSVTGVYRVREINTYENHKENQPWGNVVRQITSIGVDDSFYGYNLTSTKHWFEDATGLTDLDSFAALDMSKVTNMAFMFYKCENLVSVRGLRNWNVSKVTTLEQTFSACQKLASLEGLENWNTGKVTSMRGTFWYTGTFTDLEALRGWNTSKVTTMEAMFEDYYVWTGGGSHNPHTPSLVSTRGIEDWDVSQVTKVNAMFSQNTALETAYLNGWQLPKCNNINSMFYGDSALTTIYCDYDWVTDSLVTTDSVTAFSGCTSLIGGNGTAYDTLQTGIGMAVVDRDEINGYFTSDRKPDCGYAVLGDNGNLTFLYGVRVPNVGEAYMDHIGKTSVVRKYIVPENAADPCQLKWNYGGNTQVKSIHVDESFAEMKPENMAYWFSGMTAMQSVTGLENIDEGGVLDMNHLFYNDSALTAIKGINRWECGTVKNMSYMFANCTVLPKLNLAVMNPVKCTNTGYMFAGSRAITTIWCSYDWNSISGLTSSAQMFYFGGQMMSVVGGNGTVYDSGHTNKQYARPDIEEIPGYYTDARKSVTVEPSDPDKGTVEGSGIYFYEGEATVKATPVGSNLFAGWYDGTDIVSSDEEYTFTVMKNTHLTALFTTGDTVTVTLHNGDDDYGTTSGSVEWPRGKKILIHAVPKKGYEFYGWFDADGNPVSKDADYSFTADADVELTAVWGEKNSYVAADPYPNTYAATGSNYWGYFEECNEGNPKAEDGWTMYKSVFAASGTKPALMKVSFRGAGEHSFYICDNNVNTPESDIAGHYSVVSRLDATTDRGVLSEDDIYIQLPERTCDYTGFGSDRWYKVSFNVEDENIHSFYVSSVLYMNNVYVLIPNDYQKVTPVAESYGVTAAKTTFARNEAIEASGFAVTAQQRSGLTIHIDPAEYILAPDVAPLTEGDFDVDLKLGDRRVGTVACDMQFSDPVTLDVYNTQAQCGFIMGRGTYERNSEVTVTATPHRVTNRGAYGFYGWYDSNGIRVSTEPAYTFTLTDDTDLTAVWAYGDRNENYPDSPVTGTVTLETARTSYYTDEAIDTDELVVKAVYENGFFVEVPYGQYTISRTAAPTRCLPFDLTCTIAGVSDTKTFGCEYENPVVMSLYSGNKGPYSISYSRTVDPEGSSGYTRDTVNNRLVYDNWYLDQNTNETVCKAGTPVTLNAVENPTASYRCWFYGWADQNGTIVSTDATYTFSITEDTAITGLAHIYETDLICVDLQPDVNAYGWEAIDNRALNPKRDSGWKEYRSTNHADLTYSVMKVTFHNAEEFSFYINSYADDIYDYTIVSELDAATYPTTYLDGYANTRGKQEHPNNPDYPNTDRALNEAWTRVTFTPGDKEEHWFYVVYRKDSADSMNLDTGYLLFDSRYYSKTLLVEGIEAAADVNPYNGNNIDKDRIYVTATLKSGATMTLGSDNFIASPSYLPAEGGEFDVTISSYDVSASIHCVTPMRTLSAGRPMKVKKAERKAEDPSRKPKETKKDTIEIGEEETEEETMETETPAEPETEEPDLEDAESEDGPEEETEKAEESVPEEPETDVLDSPAG